MMNLKIKKENKATNMLDFEKELKIILKNDPLNILVLIAKNPPITSNQRLIESFKEINKLP